MIVYDKEQKEIVIPNGIGNISLYNNGVEAGYNQGYEQGQVDSGANARVLDVTKNGVYKSKYSDPIIPTVTGVYADGTDFYNYAELNGKVFNTKIAGSINSRLEFWYKGDNTLAGDAYNVIIGSGNNDDSDCFQVRYVTYTNNILSIGVGNSIINFSGWDDTVWHHLIISKEEGLWIDGKKMNWDFSPTNTVNGEFFINGINYDVNSDRAGTRNANGTFGMIKIDDVVFIPTANGFQNVNTGELLEVVKDGGYTFTENKIIYGEGELYKTVNVNVPDLNGSYDEGYAQGKTDGINEQKGKLESINITENGTYRKEDGYNEVVVNVPDLNGSYQEGYEQGQADVAANARVLNVTENGNYLSKFSDPIIPANVTGVYADGTNFYSYAYLEGISYDSGFIVSEDMKVEIWWKGDVSKTDSNLFGSQVNNNNAIFKIRIPDTAYRFDGEINMRAVTYLNAESDRWYHFKISYADGFWVDGAKIGDFPRNISGTPDELYINSNTHSSFNGANGYFGMIKITTNGVENIITPTANGFLNTNTGELLEVVKNGSYIFTENAPIYPEGELYKTINVNVIPKINVQKTGLKLGFSTFTEVPEWVDFEGIADMSNMFMNCTNLETIPQIDTSNVTNMKEMFNNCSNLQTIPLIDTSNVVNMESMFSLCSNLKTIPPLNTSKVTDMYSMFWGCNNLTSIPALNAQSLNMPSYYGVFGYNELPNITDFGGFLNLKCSLTNDNNLKKLPNLTKESCINVLNGLYDFVAAGETPNSEQGQLKVAQSFIDKVGDEISIGTAKGWQITV